MAMSLLFIARTPPHPTTAHKLSEPLYSDNKWGDIVVIICYLQVYGRPCRRGPDEPRATHADQESHRLTGTTRAGGPHRHRGPGALALPSSPGSGA